MWLPFISEHFPGSGITPFTVDDLTFWWWRIYRARAVELRDALKKQAEEAKKNTPKRR